MSDSSGRAPVCANCPVCAAPLSEVRYSGGYLNEDQFDSIRAGDWYCRCVSVDSPLGKVLRGYRYFWNRDLPPTASAPPRTEAPETFAHVMRGTFITPSPSADTGGAAETEVLVANAVTAARDAGFCRGRKWDDEDANRRETRAVDALRDELASLRARLAESETLARTLAAALRQDHDSGDYGQGLADRVTLADQLLAALTPPEPT